MEAAGDQCPGAVQPSLLRGVDLETSVLEHFDLGKDEFVDSKKGKENRF